MTPWWFSLLLSSSQRALLRTGASVFSHQCITHMSAWGTALFSALFPGACSELLLVLLPRILKTRSYRRVTLQNVTEVPFQFPCCAAAAPLGERHHQQSPLSALPGLPECVCLGNGEDSTDKDADSNLFSDRLTDGTWSYWPHWTHLLSQQSCTAVQWYLLWTEMHHFYICRWLNIFKLKMQNTKTIFPLVGQPEWIQELTSRTMST